MQEVTGNTAGLKPGQLRMLERIYRRRVAPRDVVGAELAAFLCECAIEIGRQVGILIDRRGHIDHVVVGDAHRLFLPDVGRLRAARGRFRGLRLVHTHLRAEPLSRDDLTDLALLRLDLVAAISAERGGRAGHISVAHLLPPSASGEAWRVLPSEPVHHLSLDFEALIRSLEEEFARATDRVALTDAGKDKAILIHVSLGRRESKNGAPPALATRHADSKARVDELCELCQTAGVRVQGVVTQFRAEADPRYLIGRGKLEEIVVRAMQLGAEVLIFDPDLTPGQARAISDFTELKVMDRAMLILDIFAQRARSRDGKLQVELAQLRHALPRLVEKNTMMSRLTGGIGGRGPGETKLEINRRRARERITRLEKQIDELSRHRQVRRGLRTERAVPIVSIVGYTNAGKSTLLNTLTHAEVYASDQLFATLDPTSRRLRFPREREVVLTDTVGFIRDLPQDLVNAFRATLEELDDASLLIHVVDAADPDFEQHIDAVSRILAGLGLAEKPRLLVFNKQDLLPADEVQARARSWAGLPISASDPLTLAPLLEKIEEELWKERRVAPPEASDIAVTSSASPSK
ncbi:MAG: GTPase HflX [Deltaproteobacteria bacterium]|nr:GTPase HflX [Deltaproteobacteria bacterium]